MPSLKVSDYMNRQPVIDYHGALVGIISRTDILRAINLHLKGFYEP